MDTEINEAVPASQAKEKVTVITSAVAKEKYPVRKGFKTANGGTVRDVGDEVAVALRGKGIDDWLNIAEANGRRADLQAVADNHPSNPGMVRMALGTMLRAALKAHAENPEKNPRPILSVGGTPNPSQTNPAAGTPSEDEGEDEGDDEVSEEDDSDSDGSHESSNAV